MNGKLSRAARAVAYAALVAGLGACSWFTDFKEQPKYDPWESPSDTIPMRGNPQNSVSVYGSAAPGFAVGRERMPATVDSMKSIVNPVPADARSLRNGRMNYQINCAVCHGEAGGGFATAPIRKYNAIFAPPLAAGSNAATALSDGYIWGIIRNGRGAMPSYNRIEELDRWDVVNYIRGLQGKYTVATGPVGLPGETGDKVPGYSQTGPTRPSPWYHRAGSQAGPTRDALSAGHAAAASAVDSTATQPMDSTRGTQPPAAPTTPTPKTGGER